MGLGAAIQLQSVSLLNLVPFAAGLALVLAATAAAAFQPARRATRVDPAETLRADGKCGPDRFPIQAQSCHFLPI